MFTYVEAEPWDDTSEYVLGEVDAYIDSADNTAGAKTDYGHLRAVADNLFDAMEACVDNAQFEYEGEMVLCSSVERRTRAIYQEADDEEYSCVPYGRALKLLHARTSLSKAASAQDNHGEKWVLAEADFNELRDWKEVMTALDN